MSAFDKIIGYDKEKEELQQLCDMAQNPAKYAALGVKLPRGILLHGMPGVGKTLMASALVEEMGRGLLHLPQRSGKRCLRRHCPQRVCGGESACAFRHFSRRSR